MSKKSKKRAKRSVKRIVRAAKLAQSDDVVWKQTAEEATLAGKPHYNGFACGHGAHGDKKYNRCKEKRKWRNDLRSKGASNGSFLFINA